MSEAFRPVKPNSSGCSSSSRIRETLFMFSMLPLHWDMSRSWKNTSRSSEPTSGSTARPRRRYYSPQREPRDVHNPASEACWSERVAAQRVLLDPAELLWLLMFSMNNRKQPETGWKLQNNIYWEVKGELLCTTQENLVF